MTGTTGRDEFLPSASSQGFCWRSDYDGINCYSPPDTVCRQTPTAGTYAFRGDTILVWIAGPPPK